MSSDHIESLEPIIIVDFGSQYSHLIARRVRELNVYCELVSPDTPWLDIVALYPKGIILSGGPRSVYDHGAPIPPEWVLASGIPVLGICYGLQAIVHKLGGKVVPGQKR